MRMLFERYDGPLPPTPAGQPVPNRFSHIHGFIGGFLPLAFIVLCLRLYSRWRFSYIGADDIMAIVAFLLFLGLIVATFMAMKFGLGVHIADVNFNLTGVEFAKSGYSIQTLYPAALGAVKLSILLVLARVLPETSLWRIRIYIIAGFVVCHETAFTLVLLFQCLPVAANWHPNVERKCINKNVYYYVDASVNVFSDVLVWSLPWMIFSSLRVPRRKKYALLAICSVGVFTLGTSIVRFPFLYKLTKSKDPSWDIADITCWSIAELGSAITTASIPPIRPLISSIFPRFMRPSPEETDPTFTSGDRRSFPLSVITIPKSGESGLPNSAYAEMHNGDDVPELGRSEEESEGDDFVITESGKVVMVPSKAVSKNRMSWRGGTWFEAGDDGISSPVGSRA